MLCEKILAGAVYAIKNNEAGDKNLNGEAKFGDDRHQSIVCRHLASRYLGVAHPFRVGKKKANTEKTDRLINQTLGSVDNITKNLPCESRAENIYSHIVGHSPFQYEVSHDQWGKFFASKFREMYPEEERFFLVDTTNHG